MTGLANAKAPARANAPHRMRVLGAVLALAIVGAAAVALGMVFPPAPRPLSLANQPGFVAGIAFGASVVFCLIAGAFNLAAHLLRAKDGVEGDDEPQP